MAKSQDSLFILERSVKKAIKKHRKLNGIGAWVLIKESGDCARGHFKLLSREP